MSSIRHVGITVRHLWDSLQFWKALGFKVVFEIERGEPFIGEIVGHKKALLRIAMLRRGEATIELIEYVRPLAQVLPYSETYIAGHMHVCLTDDGKLGHLLRKHAKLIIGSAKIPGGPQAGATASYFRGPDGEVIELFTPADA